MRKVLIIFGALLLLLKLAVFVRDVSKSRAKIEKQQQKQQPIPKTQAAPKTKTIPLKETTSTNDTTVYNIVETMPYLQSCASETNPQKCSEKKLTEFIYKHIRYNIRKHEFPDQFFFSFIIEKDGTVSNVQEKRGNEKTNFKEIIHQLSWIPGKIKGQPKRVKFALPMRVHFDID